jgi:hypothetical protein
MIHSRQEKKEEAELQQEYVRFAMAELIEY